MYTLSTIRNKAFTINYRVTKGFTHFQDTIFYDRNGERSSGYMVEDLSNGFYLPGCYNESFDYLWDVDDVVEFLQGQYELLGLKW